MALRVGAHLSIAGGYHNAIDAAIDRGCNALQIFSASPKGWNFPRPQQHMIDDFVRAKAAAHIDPVFFHASYLVNLGDTGRIGSLSRQLLIHELKLAKQMEVAGSIIHLGSFKTNGNGHEQLVENIRLILEKIPQDRWFIMENAGNRKIGQKLEDLAQVIEQLKDERLKVCLDTCHLHAAGYDLTTPSKFEEFITMFDQMIGLDRLALWHINDSRDPFGSLRDRHDNLGEGMVGVEVFRQIVNDSRTRDIPMIIETPGFDGSGPDKQNIDLLKSYQT